MNFTKFVAKIQKILYTGAIKNILIIEVKVLPLRIFHVNFYNMKSLVLPFFILLSLLCNAQPPQLSEKAVSIPLGGNTFVTTRDSASNGKIGNAGIERWTNPLTVYSTYFRVSKPGNMLLFLKYDASDHCEIKVSCGKSEFLAQLPQGTNQIVYIGTVEKVDTGYVCVNFQGIKRSGNEFATASALLVDGEVKTGKMNFVDDFSFYFGRRGPSVHLNYPFPEGEIIEWFYNEITVPVGEDPVGSYYMSNGFAEGYFGMQVNSPAERRILFSVWSPFQTDNPSDIPEDQKIKMLMKGEDVIAGEFGNEGAGGQSYLKYRWITGNTYKFLTRIRPDGKGSTEYTAYFYAPELNKWRLVAQFLRPKTDTWYKRAHSFLESFHPEYGYISRKGLYHNQWARTKEGRWIELTSARFTADDTARKGVRMDYKGGTTDGKFFLQNCGFLNDYSIIGATFSRPASGVEPVIDWNQINSAVR